ncbi:MAG: zinc-ribbon domain-containing protein [Syntrophales bacterium]
MIIQCNKCATRFRFDENNLEGEGIWVRCSRCRDVFFLENRNPDSPVPTETADENGGLSPADVKAETKDSLEKDGPLSGPPEEDAEEEFTDHSHVDMKAAGRGGLWTPGKITAYIVILVIVLGGVYLTLFPQVGKHILFKISPAVAKYFGLEADGIDPLGGGIDFLDVREHIIENRMAGKLLVVQGLAVNKNKYLVSRIKVRVRLIDSAGEFVGQADSYCGNLLSDEELTNLTEKEIKTEFAAPEGKSIPNSNIGPDGSIPFMTVIINPPSKTDFIVELADLQKQ